MWSYGKVLHRPTTMAHSRNQAFGFFMVLIGFFMVLIGFFMVLIFAVTAVAAAHHVEKHLTP